MKRVRYLTVAIFLGAVLQLQAICNETSRLPAGLGIKLGISGSGLWDYTQAEGSFDHPDDGRIYVRGQRPKHSVLGNPMVTTTVYGEYAFNNYLGIMFEMGYLKCGAITAIDGTANRKAKKYSNKITFHHCIFPIGCYIYPWGRSMEVGVPKFLVGCMISFDFLLALRSFSKSDHCRWDNYCLYDEGIHRKIDFAVMAGGGFEFDCGLSLELKGMMGFVSVLKPTVGHAEEVSESFGLKKVKNYAVVFTVGWNVASWLNKEKAEVYV